MHGPLTLTIVVFASLLTLAAGVTALRNRRVRSRVLAIAGVTTIAVLAQLVAGVLALGSADPGVSTVLFVAYLVGTLLVVPVAVAWAIGEPSRWGAGVLAVAGLVVLVLEARLHQIWTNGA